MMALHQLKATLISRRTTMIDALGRAEAFLESYDEQRDQTQVPIRLEYLNSMWATLEEIQGQLEDTEETEEGYYTILAQIEAVMNSRPLLPMSDDPNDLAALTPAHFLVGASMSALPDPDYQHQPISALGMYQNWQLLVQRFWSHWKKEYLQEMIRDTKYAARNNEIQPGRMVILADESLPAIRWPLARIIAVHPGRDNIPRVVTLRTAKGIITRTFNKICLLPQPTSPENEHQNTASSSLESHPAASPDDDRRDEQPTVAVPES